MAGEGKSLPYVQARNNLGGESGKPAKNRVAERIKSPIKFKFKDRRESLICCPSAYENCIEYQTGSKQSFESLEFFVCFEFGLSGFYSGKIYFWINVHPPETHPHLFFVSRAVNLQPLLPLLCIYFF